VHYTLLFIHEHKFDYEWLYEERLHSEEDRPPIKVHWNFIHFFLFKTFINKHILDYNVPNERVRGAGPAVDAVGFTAIPAWGVSFGTASRAP
jgi:hypothetical protein